MVTGNCVCFCAKIKAEASKDEAAWSGCFTDAVALYGGESHEKMSLQCVYREDEILLWFLEYSSYVSRFDV